MRTWEQISLGDILSSCGDHKKMAHVQGEHLVCFLCFSGSLLVLWCLASRKGKIHCLEELAMFIMHYTHLTLVYCRSYHILRSMFFGFCTTRVCVTHVLFLSFV